MFLQVRGQRPTIQEDTEGVSSVGVECQYNFAIDVPDLRGENNIKILHFQNAFASSKFIQDVKLLDACDEETNSY